MVSYRTSTWCPQVEETTRNLRRPPLFPFHGPEGQGKGGEGRTEDGRGEKKEKREGERNGDRDEEKEGRRKRIKNKFFSFDLLLTLL